jgi:hypothetical protein
MHFSPMLSSLSFDMKIQRIEGEKNYEPERAVLLRCSPHLWAKPRHTTSSSLEQESQAQLPHTPSPFRDLQSRTALLHRALLKSSLGLSWCPYLVMPSSGRHRDRADPIALPPRGHAPGARCVCACRDGANHTVSFCTDIVGFATAASPTWAARSMMVLRPKSAMGERMAVVWSAGDDLEALLGWNCEKEVETRSAIAGCDLS